MIGPSVLAPLLGGVAYAVASAAMSQDLPTNPSSTVAEPVETAQVEADTQALEELDADILPVEPVALAFADLSDDEIVSKVLDYLDGLTTAEATFVQSSPSGAVQDGKLWLRRPRQLRMAYGSTDDPSLLIVATQGNVYVRDSALETTDFYPVGKTPLRFLLTKELKAETLEVLAVQRGVESVAVTFTDATGEAEGDLTVVLDAPTLALRQWVVRDPQNNLTVVSLENLQEGGKVSNRLFRIPDAGGQFINN